MSPDNMMAIAVSAVTTLRKITFNVFAFPSRVARTPVLLARRCSAAEHYAATTASAIGSAGAET